jgi:hypothetical protein
MTQRSQRVATACVIGFFALSFLVYWLVPSVRRIDPDAEARWAASSSLHEAYLLLCTAAIKKPDGKGCTSIEEAVNSVVDTTHLRSYWADTNARAFVHPNPDWGKWLVAATNDRLYSNELSAFCDPAVTSSNRLSSVFIGMTFGGDIIELSNTPPWPQGAHWLNASSQ